MTMVLSPTFRGATFPVIDLPLAVIAILCLTLSAIGVNVIRPTLLATVVAYRNLSLLKLGLSVPEDKDNLVKAGLRRVTCSV